MGKSSDPIYEKLKNEIVMLEIEPGTMLREVDIGERFNVSRTPARDVFVRLQRDHLVEVVSQKGTYVTKINIEDVTDIMYLRKTIEENIISTLIDKISLDQINILHLILIHQKEILAIEDEKERRTKFYDNDNKFHATMYGFANKRGVWDIISNLSPTYNRYRNITYLRKIERLSDLYKQHSKILKCIEDGDKEGALKALEEHFYSGLSGIDEVFHMYKEYFD